MPGISPSRKTAFEILLSVATSNAHSDALLHGHRTGKLSEPDRNLATALVLGVLRWQQVLDAHINPLLARPNARLDTEVRIALRLAAFQLLHLYRIPARAAIDESVELTKRSGHIHAARMVNAVLRKLAAAAGPLREKFTAETESAAIAAHPSWLVERWTAHYGADAARALCLHGQAQPQPIARLVDAAAEDTLAAAGVQLAPASLLTAARRVESAPSQFEFPDAALRMQDEGSQLIGEIAGLVAASPTTENAPNTGAILDACAAPGGKTLILAERNPQARIVAGESSEQRAAALHKRLAHLGPRVEVFQADATALPLQEQFDVVLADVPCSGTGTLGRNPEIRHRLTPEDIARHAARQQAILASAIQAAKPGGHVVYSTCSLEPEENEHVVAAVLAQLPSARIAPLSTQLDAMQARGILTPTGKAALQNFLTPEGFLRLLPNIAQTDGFFVCLLEK